jgi:hypothetical protein
MTNAELATKIIISYFEAENIQEQTPTILARVNKWEARLNPLDALSLAAVAISDPPEIFLTIPEIRQLREFYFPSSPATERSFI